MGRRGGMGRDGVGRRDRLDGDEECVCVEMEREIRASILNDCSNVSAKVKVVLCIEC